MLLREVLKGTTDGGATGKPPPPPPTSRFAAVVTDVQGSRHIHPVLGVWFWGLQPRKEIEKESGFHRWFVCQSRLLLLSFLQLPVARVDWSKLCKARKTEPGQVRKGCCARFSQVQSRAKLSQNICFCEPQRSAEKSTLLRDDVQFSWCDVQKVADALGRNFLDTEDEHVCNAMGESMDWDISLVEKKQDEDEVLADAKAFLRGAKPFRDKIPAAGTQITGDGDLPKEKIFGIPYSNQLPCGHRLTMRLTGQLRGHRIAPKHICTPIENMVLKEWEDNPAEVKRSHATQTKAETPWQQIREKDKDPRSDIRAEAKREKENEREEKKREREAREPREEKERQKEKDRRRRKKKKRQSKGPMSCSLPNLMPGTPLRPLPSPCSTTQAPSYQNGMTLNPRYGLTM
ncbi:uncharacterized protein [Macrobrachium rosenbergii]|uniref:uncharacterized protein n=1 Tax=Macrobrachium rosenbergii TaxID=79674 RepID=UPI0034D488E9